ncbi:MAG: hypothetical protein A2987_03655 [Omnitrophica bacterium RIFCSPLOWO2_01_FULL_45_10]|nr:MAG: hypothetical protein A2987_03655 [Omnitrophica bacterium RIFCSPLOWO2_01_FULL_45_10]
MNIVLVGNPNVGKSVIFNALTGRYVTVSNYPGTTVEISKGIGKFAGQKIQILDTPGINSLVPYSEDEKVTKDILSKSDVAAIVHVADSKNLKRSLLLTLDLMELKTPMVLNLNMADEAKEHGIKIDTKKLSEKLGIDVVETVAITGEGVGKLKDSIQRARVPQGLLSQGLVETHHFQRPMDIVSLNKKNKIIDNILSGVLTVSKHLKKSVAEAIGRITTRPITGIPFLIVILIIMYKFVGQFAAGTAVDFFEETVFGKYLTPFFVHLATRFIPINLIREFLIGDYGVISMAVTYAFAIIFPIVTAFFLFFGILEDTGYLPRLSVLSDRIFRVIGLNGRAILPVILGLGCGTMATLTARILDTKKERILVNLLLALAIPCSAQLGVIMGILGSMSRNATALWIGVILSVMIIVGFVSSKIIPGSRSPFIQEIPPIRMPQIGNIVTKTLARLKWYLKEAVPLFILGTIALFVFDKFGILKVIENIFRPIVVGLLGLPEKVTEVFIIGFLRRDYGAAGLFQLSKTGILDTIQILVSIVVITLFVPCIAQFFVTIKERGMKVAALIGGFVFVFAFLVGGVLNFVLRQLVSRGITVI